MESPYICPEFSDIFENSILNGKFEEGHRYYVERDNFYEVNRSWLNHNDINKEELRRRFIRPPKLTNKRDYEYAAATALYYLNKFGLDSVKWVEDALEEVDKDKEDIVCWFIKKDEDIERERENTPEEFKKFGFIMDEKHISIR